MQKAGILSVCLILLLLTFSACKDDMPEGLTGEVYAMSCCPAQTLTTMVRLFSRKRGIAVPALLSGWRAYKALETFISLCTCMRARMSRRLLTAGPVESITNLDMLMEGTAISYEELLEFDGHIKVHLGESGEDKEVILAYGNIGWNH